MNKRWIVVEIAGEKGPQVDELTGFLEVYIYRAMTEGVADAVGILGEWATADVRVTARIEPPISPKADWRDESSPNRTNYLPE